ncbi:hypothetical protein [Poritiphilus flavus]|uniref:Uncharacterized protein n=1 Tax=Poritiphilus flavus TaxID=2697053 RepID=A0A6L9EED9_9FLAO|nr:hypothetical protein [Poritiphilus flavus]NAS13124.1 hypothetical protein [Poritiphilus flavus]
MRKENIIYALCSSILFFSCVQETHLKEVTFKVDMRAVDSVSAVGIRGQFTDPAWRVKVPMTDDDGDGIYETTISEKTAQNSVAFKFVNRDSIFELQGKDNRYLKFEYRPQKLVLEAVFDELGTQQLLETN